MKRSVKRPAAERFWEMVDKSSGPDACWIFPRAHCRDGYGHFSLDGKTIPAHRAAYLLERGPIPSGHVVRHACDNPPCVNPDHLLVGTQADNVRDKCERDRHLYGEKHPQAVLTRETVEMIRALYSEGGVTQTELAKRFGVSHKGVSQIVLGRRWRSAGGPVAAPSRVKTPPLTSQQIAEIKSAHKAGGLTYRQLGLQFGLTRWGAWSVVNGRVRGTVTKPMGEFEKIHRVKLSAT